MSWPTREADLYPPVRDWLRARGYDVYVERFDCDVLGLHRDTGELVVVELKLGRAVKLWSQLHRAAAFAHRVYGALPRRPENVQAFRHSGFGLLIVTETKVRQIAKARPQPWGWYKKHAYRWMKLQTMSPAREHEVAGLPACSQLAQQRRETNP